MTSLISRLVLVVVLVWFLIYSLTHLAAALLRYWWATLFVVVMIVAVRAVARPRQGRSGGWY